MQKPTSHEAALQVRKEIHSEHFRSWKRYIETKIEERKEVLAVDDPEITALRSLLIPLEQQKSKDGGYV